jgi:hypothetical protein
MTIKHFNVANIRGRVEGVPTTKRDKEGKGSPYLRLKINCASQDRGNVVVYAQMRNKAKYEALLEHIKKHPATAYHFRAFYNQYPKDRGDENSERRSAFSIWEWAPDPEEGKTPKATFVLTGAVLGIEKDKLALQLNRENNNEELFDLYALRQSQLNGLTEGETIEVCGYMMTKGGADEFDRPTSSPILPYIKEITVRKEKSEGGTPF